MPSDFSRLTFDPRKHYAGVLHQQGRVQTDADFNEQADILQYRTHMEATDVIGQCGVPVSPGGFEITAAPDGSDLLISPGRLYVDGLLCELDGTPVAIGFNDNPRQVIVNSLLLDGRLLAEGEWVEVSGAEIQERRVARIEEADSASKTLTLSREVSLFQNSATPFLRRTGSYLTQPDYPRPGFAGENGALQLGDGFYLVYLKAWQREINYLDDRAIREVALGGPDTTARRKNVWQVRLLSVGLPRNIQPDCSTPFAEWDAETSPSTGVMNARTQIAEEEKNPCLLPPSAGYTRLENQLYRVEIHQGGFLSQATFKFSRDNATVETRIQKIDGKILTVASVGKDEYLGFAADQWVEIVDEDSELNFSPRPLLQVDTVNPAKLEIALKTDPPPLAEAVNLKLRRWDNPPESPDSGIALSTEWTALESGIQVQFSEGFYRTGDYWLIPARTVTGDIEWPEAAAGSPVAQPPKGISRHYCRLALLQVKGRTISVRDCRHLFPPLTGVMTAEEGIRVEQITSRNDAGVVAALANDTEVLVNSIFGGIQVQCDREPDPMSVRRPTCFVTVELPFQQARQEEQEPGAAAYFALNLAGNVDTQGRIIRWSPTSTSRRLLSNLPDLPAGDRGFLTRLTLKGNFVWALNNPDLYLDGDVFGQPGGEVPATALRLPSGDRRRGGDFEMWFWLTKPAPVTQFGLTAQAGFVTTVRLQGIAELAGDIVLSGTGGTPTAAGQAVPRFNITVAVNTTITSPPLNQFADVVLLIDDPVTLNTAALGTTPPVNGAGGAGLDYRNGNAPNLFLGVRVSNNSVVFQNVPIDPPAAGATRTLRVKNLRVNANALGPGTVAPSMVQAFVSVSGPATVPVTNPTVTLGFVSSAANRAVRRSDGAPGIFTFQQAQGVNVALARSITSTAGVRNVDLEFAEGFTSAFKVRKQGSVAPYGPRVMEEAGFDNQGSGALPLRPGSPALPVAMGGAQSGTRFLAVFRGVPTGVRLFVTTRDIPDAVAATPVRAQLIAPDLSGGGSGQPVPPVTQAQGIPIAELAVAGGAAVALWEWVFNVPVAETQLNTIRFGLVIAALPGQAQVTDFPATVELSIAPVSTNVNPTGSPVPRFIASGQQMQAFRATSGGIVVGGGIGGIAGGGTVVLR